MDTGVGSGVADSEKSEQSSTVSGDPTQQLLTSLGKFQRHLTDAQSETSNELWSDECMNQLISAVDTALSQEWSSMVEALTDTGRILQTYQSAERASDCVPFLNDAYEVLCLMVGDLIVDSESTALSENWRRLYQGAVRAVEETGLRLAHDDEEAPPEAVPTESKSDEYEILLSVEGEPEGGSAAASAGESGSEAPELGELPPLESMLEEEQASPVEPLSLEVDLSPPEPLEIKPGIPEIGLVSNSDSLAEPPPPPPPPAAPELDELEELDSIEEIAPEAPAEEPPALIDEPPVLETAPVQELDVLEEPGEPDAVSPEPAATSASGTNDRLVEILDTLCEHLDAIQKSTEDDRSLAVQRFEAGLEALTREADDSGHIIASGLCGLMREVSKAGTTPGGLFDDRVIDLGYAFCGVYMDAVGDGENDGIYGWQRECEALIESLKSAPVETPSAVETGPPVTQMEEITLDAPVDPLAAESMGDVLGSSDPLIEEIETLPTGPAAELVEEIEPVSIEEAAPVAGEADLSIQEIELHVEPASPVADAPVLGDAVAEPPMDASEGLLEAAVPPPLPVTHEASPSEEQPDPPAGSDTSIAEGAAPDSVEEIEILVEQPEAPPMTVAEPSLDTSAAASVPAETTIEQAPEPPADPLLDQGLEGADEYGQLLASARNAASSGDMVGAKYYALQAAAYIARSEYEKTASSLSACEESLKQSWDMTEDARNEVEKAEGDVRSAATSVVSSESALGEASEGVAIVVQEVDDIQSAIDDLDGQISELQARRDAEAENLETTTGRMRQAEEDARKSGDHLQESKSREQEARAYLESCRRNVKDKQRQTADMEAEMAEARELLAQREQSCDEIEHTVKQICGDKIPPESNDTMLF